VLPSCLTPSETALELWLDLPSVTDVPARIIAIEHNSVLIQTEPEIGEGEPLLLVKYSDEVVTLTVSEPHEPALRAVALAFGNVVLCGDASCRVYDVDEDGMHLLAEPQVPMDEGAIEGAAAIGDFWSSSAAPVAFCVHGDGVFCLEDGVWSELASPGDRLLAVGNSTSVEYFYAGENGRMGRLSRLPDTDAPPVWTELERVTEAHLRAASGWFAAGDDGALIQLGDEEARLCDTGDQDWTIYAQRLISATGQILYFRDPEVEMGGPCLRSGPSERSFR